MRDFKDKVAVVTGGSSGIGQAIALALANCGCRVAVVGTAQERIDGTLALMPTGRESPWLRLRRRGQGGSDCHGRCCRE